MESIETLYKRNIDLFQKEGIDYKEYSHEPVLDYEVAAKIRERFKLLGVESKNLFLKTKKGDYCMLITLQEKRADFNMLKDIFGCKVSVASHDELKQKTGCEPNCAVPFGHSSDIILIVDNKIFSYPSFIFSPGPPDKTVEVSTEAVKKILGSVKNKTIYI